MFQKLILIRGVPGSGKTTFAKKLSNDLSSFVSKGNIAHYEADMFFMDEEGNYNWEPGKLPKAHEWCYRKAVESLERYKLSYVIVSNTFTTLKEMEPYIQLAKRNGANLDVYRLDGKYKNVHNVPDSVIEKMYARFEDFPKEHLM